MKKKFVLIHLNRRLDDLTATPDHVKMAKMSMDYQARQRALEAEQAKQEKHMAEINALRAAIAFIQNSSLAEDSEMPAEVQA